MNIRIDEMRTGIRRQEVWGDITALAARSLHNDRLHPSMVNDQLTLIARSQPLMVSHGSQILAATWYSSRSMVKSHGGLSHG
jgi:cAMP phosphodiesterase